MIKKATSTSHHTKSTQRRPQGKSLTLLPTELWFVLLKCFILDKFSVPMDDPINTFLIPRNKSLHVTSAITSLNQSTIRKASKISPSPNTTFYPSSSFVLISNTCYSLRLLQNLFVLVLSHCPIPISCLYFPLCLVRFYGPSPLMYLQLPCISFLPSYSPGISQAGLMNSLTWLTHRFLVELC